MEGGCHAAAVTGARFGPPAHGASNRKPARTCRTLCTWLSFSQPSYDTQLVAKLKVGAQDLGFSNLSTHGPPAWPGARRVLRIPCAEGQIRQIAYLSKKGEKRQIVHSGKKGKEAADCMSCVNVTTPQKPCARCAMSVTAHGARWKPPQSCCLSCPCARAAWAFARLP